MKKILLFGAIFLMLSLVANMVTATEPGTGEPVKDIDLLIKKGKLAPLGIKDIWVGTYGGKVLDSRHETMKAIIQNMRSMASDSNETEAKDNVGILLRGITKDQLEIIDWNEFEAILKERNLLAVYESGGWMKIMRKAELIEAIASDASLTKADARRALDAFVGATTKSLKDGKRVALVGFGSFSISNCKARTERNSQTVVRFKAGDMPFLPNVEYTTTEDIIKAIADADSPENESTSGETKRDTGSTEKQAKQFMNSFIDVILKTVKTGVVVDVGEDFGKFWIPPIGHVDHGKGQIFKGNGTRRNPQTGAEIRTPAKKVVRFKAGSDLAKTVK